MTSSLSMFPPPVRRGSPGLAGPPLVLLHQLQLTGELICLLFMPVLPPDVLLILPWEYYM